MCSCSPLRTSEECNARASRPPVRGPFRESGWLASHLDHPPGSRAGPRRRKPDRPTSGCGRHAAFAVTRRPSRLSRPTEEGVDVGPATGRTAARRASSPTARRRRSRSATASRSGLPLDEGHREGAAVDVAGGGACPRGPRRSRGRAPGNPPPATQAPRAPRVRMTIFGPFAEKRRRPPPRRRRRSSTGRPVRNSASVSFTARPAEPRERRVAHGPGGGEVEQHQLAEPGPEVDHVIERLRRDLALARSPPPPPRSPRGPGPRAPGVRR